ncbi:hemerythrin domain-containing protein [Seohaeicola zhoushanensis]|uniref:Hemerythrin-like domain-containing protein n=1 Tax=Seohaeicola zhoushanensis TaxID=1569283 RepID=A0A8J3H3P9_9RHOB|nr:hemerythrin domain-containing protein [Seohaeicola zhoushanensis]GHF74069.1 hypothetical protein GCM10017056_50990 [Seohaeicola zhoushanensis]
MRKPATRLYAARLTRFIETEFHARHRAQLLELVALSEKVEALHAGEPKVPAGLGQLLCRMVEELEVHMKKEELILFPAIRRNAALLDPLIAEVRADHDDHKAEVGQIMRLTDHQALAKGACRRWMQLYAGIGAFLDDLLEHIRLENEVLFPHFETKQAGHA